MHASNKKSDNNKNECKYLEYENHFCTICEVYFEAYFMIASKMSNESSYRLFQRIEYQKVYVLLFAVVLAKVNSTLNSSHKKE